MKRKKKSQSTVEYALIFVAIIAAIIFVARSVLFNKVKNVGEKAGDTIETNADKLFNGIDSSIP